jgi:hypothetical protein
VQPGGGAVVRTVRGSVDVRSHDGDELRVEAEARGRRAEQVRFVLEQSGNDVRFEVRVEGWLTGLFGSLDVRARLWFRAPTRSCCAREAATCASTASRARSR